MGIDTVSDLPYAANYDDDCEESGVPYLLRYLGGKGGKIR